MKKLALLLALGCFLQMGFAQRNFGKLVGGLEIGFDVSQLTDGFKPRFIPSFQLEVPIGSLALGAGIGRKYYQYYEYGLSTGQSKMRIEDGVPVTYYLTDIREFKPAYWTVPLKAEVRIHRCQCVYLQAGLTIDFFDSGTPDRIVFSGAEVKQPWPYELRHDDLIKKQTTSFNLGIGFNLFRSEGFRLTARPSIVWSENPEIYALYADAPKFIPTLRMNFGVQVAIIR
ncbi:MAG: hypothetical protein H7246_05275 [Phycisphaerae bacterium]|nr:hypothetical protein [Saprospiraceae bacterium]